MTTTNASRTRPAGAVPYATGFSTLAHEATVEQLPMTGALPPWLRGSLLRTGPARFEVGEHAYRHWFDGLTMLHRFTFGEGAVSYGNRFLRGKSWEKAERTGQIPYPEFATDPCRSLFKRVQTLFSPDFGDNANVNVVRLGDRFLSMTEAPISVQFDPHTLAAAGVPFLPPGTVTTAHPHLDRATGGMLNYALKLGATSEYRFFTVAPDGTEPVVTARFPVDRPGYIHSFGLTERWVVFAEFPWVVNPLSLALSGKPYAENFRWEPERGTRFFLVDRTTGQVSAPITTDAFFAFHHLNAYEDTDGTVVADLQCYADVSVVDALYLDAVRGGSALPDVRLRRFRLDPAAGTVTSEPLLDGPFELGRINYGKCNERPYRYAWGVGAERGPWLDTVVRADVVERTRSTWHEPGAYPGEPVFVAAPGAEREDDGVLLSVVLDSRSDTSFLLVLDAADLSEVARAWVPHHVPFGFHGAYASRL